MSHLPASSARPAFFHGWIIVAAAFTITFVGFGCAYSFSAFLDPLQKGFSASRGSVSLVFSVASFLYFGLGIVSGPLADRFGARRLAFAGMILAGVGLVCAGLARTLGEVYAGYGLGVGIGVGLAYVPALGAVQRWFARRRGFASGLAVAGIGVGTLVVPPLAAALIGRFGWREAYLLLGIGSAILGGAAALLLENDPRGRGLGPDGDPIDPAVRAAVPPGATLAEAITTRRFASLYAVCLVGGLGVYVPFVHLVPYAKDHGVAPQAAVWLLAIIGIGSTIGRFLLGGFADRIGRRNALLAMSIGLALAVALWAVSTSFWPLAVFALVYGICFGGWVAVLPAVVMDYFGGRNVGAIIGVLYTSVAFGTLLGPSAAGFAYDASHSYTPPILGSLLADVIAAIILMLGPGAPVSPGL